MSEMPDDMPGTAPENAIHGDVGNTDDNAGTQDSYHAATYTEENVHGMDPAARLPTRRPIFLTKKATAIPFARKMKAKNMNLSEVLSNTMQMNRSTGENPSGSWEKIGEDLNGKIHKEHEDRFNLVALPDEVGKLEPHIIRQGVLREIKDGDDVVAYARIRAYEQPGKKIKYSLGVKHFPLSQESETEVSKEIFDAFYPKNLEKPQEKKRFVLKDGWVIDQKEDGSLVAERERRHNQTSELPEGWMEKKSAYEVGLIDELEKISLLGKGSVAAAIGKRMLPKAEGRARELATDSAKFMIDRKNTAANVPEHRKNIQQMIQSLQKGKKKNG